MTPVSTWLFAIVAACLTGWILSVGGWLSCSGYGAAAALSALICWMWWVRRGPSLAWPAAARRRLWFARFRRRITTPLPVLFGIQLVFAGVGGALYAPGNFDLLIYRFPRVLHWLAASRWHWITTDVTRMNYAGTIQEWVISAMYACSHSDRAFFLLNLSAFALMPGLCFTVLRALGVRRHAAWVWMWLFPSAPVYAMQAGSGANDAIGCALLLAALYCAAVARRRRSSFALVAGCFAAALLSGVKASNLPLLAPCAIALVPSWRVILRRRLVSAIAVAAALIVSFAPTAAFNLHYTGAWTGDPGNATHLRAGDPLTGLLGNIVQAAFVNFAPPFLPRAPEISREATRLLPVLVTDRLADQFPMFHLAVNELPQEEVSGLGLGVTVLALSCLVVAGVSRLRRGPDDSASTGEILPARFVIAGGWVALLCFLALMASDATARLLAPFYILPLAGVLRLPAADVLARHRVWRMLATAVSVTTVIALILTPARPLFPAERLFALARARFPSSPFVARAEAVYSRTAHYPYLLAPVLALLPPGSSHLALVGGGPESPLWRPYGTRVVSDIADTMQLDAFAGDAVISAVHEHDGPLYDRIAQLRSAGRLRHVGRVTAPAGFAIGTLTWDVDLTPAASQKLGPIDHRQ
jgi:hypothetical protein